MFQVGIAGGAKWRLADGERGSTWLLGERLKASLCELRDSSIALRWLDMVGCPAVVSRWWVRVGVVG